MQAHYYNSNPRIKKQEGNVLPVPGVNNDSFVGAITDRPKRKCNEFAETGEKSDVYLPGDQ